MKSYYILWDNIFRGSLEQQVYCCNCIVVYYFQWKYMFLKNCNPQIQLPWHCSFSGNHQISSPPKQMTSQNIQHSFKKLSIKKVMFHVHKDVEERHTSHKTIPLVYNYEPRYITCRYIIVLWILYKHHEVHMVYSFCLWRLHLNVKARVFKTVVSLMDKLIFMQKYTEYAMYWLTIKVVLSTTYAYNYWENSWHLKRLIKQDLCIVFVNLMDITDNKS